MSAQHLFFPFSLHSCWEGLDLETSSCLGSSTTLLPDVGAFSHSGLAARETCPSEGRASAHPWTVPAVKWQGTCLRGKLCLTSSLLSKITRFVSCHGIAPLLQAIYHPFSVILFPEAIATEGVSAFISLPPQLSLFIWPKPHSWIALLHQGKRKKDKKCGLRSM